MEKGTYDLLRVKVDANSKKLTQNIDALINVCYLIIRENVLEVFYVGSI